MLASHASFTASTSFTDAQNKYEHRSEEQKVPNVREEDDDEHSKGEFIPEDVDSASIYSCTQDQDGRQHSGYEIDAGEV